MRPYSPGRPIEEVQRELGLSDVVKLASNENPLGPSPAAIKAMAEALSKLHLYPDAAGFELRHAIADRFQVPAEQIILGNGSDELLSFIGQILLESPQDEVVMGNPSFMRYDAVAHIAPSKLIKVPLNAELGLDLPATLAHITPATKIVFLANPNNPTGTIFRQSAWEAFIREVPEDVLVVLDEAYHEFADHESADPIPDGIREVRQGRPNVIALRTLSKAYGLAGIRVGFAVGPAAIIDAMQRVRPPFNVNSLGLVGAQAALADRDYLQRSVAHNTQARNRLAHILQASGAKVFESHANFVLADLGQDATPVFDALLRQGVIVRPGSVLGLPSCLRVSVGTDQEIERFETAFAAVTKNKGNA